MKKRKFLIIISFISTIFIISILAFNFNFIIDLISNFNMHILRYPHITGNIKILIDKKEIKNNNDYLLEYKNDSEIKNIKVQNNKFVIGYGDYGKNDFYIKFNKNFNKKYFNVEKETIIIYSYITSNNWHKENLELIFIKENNFIYLKFKINGDESGKNEKTIKIIELFDNKIEIIISMI